MNQNENNGFELEGNAELNAQMNAPAHQQAPQKQKETAGSKSAFSLSALSTGQYRASVGSVTDNVLNAFVETFNTAVNHEAANIPAALRRDKFKVIPLSSVSSSDCSTLLVTLPITVNGNDLTAVYILLFEQPGALTTRQMLDRNETYDALILPEHNLNSRLKERIRQQLGVTDGALKIIGQQVVTIETTNQLSAMSKGDQNAKALVVPLLNNAIDALSGYCERIMGGSPVALTPAAMDTAGHIELSLDYPSAQQSDSSGLPIRADVIAKLNFVERTSEAGAFNEAEFSRREMASVSAVLDLYLDDQQIQNDGNGFGGFGNPQAKLNQPFWQPVFDITEINAPENVPFSLELALYAISQIAKMTNDYRWVRAMRPRNPVQQKGLIKDLRDLGWLGFYNPDKTQAAYVAGISPNTSDDELLGYLSKVIKPEIAMGLTISSSSEKAHVLSIFQSIALADDNSRPALIDRLYLAANNLTGGHFAQTAKECGLLDGNVTPVISMANRELIGVWEDEHGNKRPVSEWNVLAFATAIEDRDPTTEKLREFQSTFEGRRSGRSVEHNLSIRWDLLRRHVCPSVRPVATAEKLSLNRQFVRALSLAVSKTTLESKITNADQMTRRQRAGHVAYGAYAGDGFGNITNGNGVGGNGGGYDPRFTGNLMSQDVNY